MLSTIIKTILYQPLFNALIFLIWLMPHHNVGLAIIALTVLVRLILLPSSLKAARSQKRLQELQPKLQEIQEKYKNDRAKQSQAIMEFYKKNNVSPFGSCLPLLIQFPILIVLYYVFINGLSTARFDLLYNFTPRPEAIQTMFLGFNLAQPNLWVLPVIAGVLQLIQGWQMAPKTKPQKGQEMAQMVSKQMLFTMPLITIFVAGRFPAALPLYWIITTLFAIGQQWYISKENSKVTVEKLTETAEKTKEKQSKIKGVEVTVRRKA